MTRSVRGLTLLELLLVLVIMALSVTLVYVSLDGLLPSSRLGSVAREIGGAIALAKREAALRGQETKVEYDLGGGKVRVMVPGKSEAGLSGKTELVPYGQEVLVPDQVKIDGVLLGSDRLQSGGAVTVTFTPTGGATAHIVQLKGEGQLVFSIEVHALTGTINYYDTRRSWPAVVEDGQ